MKKLLLMAILMAGAQFSFAQTNPTLAVGLETLTMNKGTIDVKVLTEIIMEKQKELKHEALKRFMFKLFPDANYTTKFYVQNCLNVLLNEKNPQVIEKEILELTTNYAFALGTTYALVKSKDPLVLDINSAFSNYKPSSLLFQEKVMNDYQDIFKKKRRLLRLEKKKLDNERIFANLKAKIKADPINRSNYDKMKCSQKKISHFKRVIAKVKLRNSIEENDKAYKHAVFILRELDTLNASLKEANSPLSENEAKALEKYIDKMPSYLKCMNVSKLQNATDSVRSAIRSDLTACKGIEKISENINAIRSINPASFNDRTKKLDSLNAGIKQRLDIIKTALVLDSVQYKKNAIDPAVIEIRSHLYGIFEIGDTASEKTEKENLAIILNQIQCCSADITNPEKDSYEKNMTVFHMAFVENDLKRLMRAKTPVEIPFGHLLDVVSLSLSEIEELQKKGFFKNKIDYRADTFYKNLEESTDGQAFKKRLDIFEKGVRSKVRTYVVNYDVIKEFINKNKSTNVEEIVNDLLHQSYEILAKEKTKFPEIVPYLNNIAEETALLENIPIVTRVIANYDLSNKNNKTNKDIWNVYQIKASLNEVSKKVTNQVIQNKTKITLRQKMEPIADLPKIGLDWDAIPTDPVQAASFSQIQIALENLNAGIDAFKANNGGMEEFSTIYEKVEELENMVNASKIPTLRINTADFKKCECFNIEKELVAFKNAVGELYKSLPDTKNIALKNKEKLENSIQESYKKIAESDLLFIKLKELLTIINPEVDLTHPFFNTNKLDSLTIKKASVIFPEMYNKVKDIVDNKEIKLQDIIYLEDYVTSKMIELKIRDHNNDLLYDRIIRQTKLIIPLLKIKVLKDIGDIGEYSEQLMTLFEFISNLNNLDRAQTYQSIVDMLRDGSKKVEDNLSEGEFKNSYILFVNAMKKYTIINPNAAKEYVEVDVVSFLNDLQQYYGRNNTSRFGLYLTLGLNQNFFFENFTFPDSVTKESINNISFASEKIGVKYRIHNVRQFTGYENAIKDDVYLNKKAPFVNEVYAIMYGSGLLYSLANTTTNENFNFPHAGLGVGVRFYNALDVNLTLGFPFVKHSNFGDHAFWGFGLDIPLGEYLEKIGNK